MSFRPNRKVRRELARQPECQAMLANVGEDVKAATERETPIGDTQDTIDRYIVIQYPTMVRVGNTDPFFHLTEFGSANNPPYAPLRRGVLNAGLRLDETAAGELDAASDPFA